MDGYVINEEDIETVIRYLKIHKPEKANRECAIQVLEIMHGAAKRVASNSPEFAEELEKALLQQDQHLQDKDKSTLDCNPKCTISALRLEPAFASLAVYGVYY